MHQFNFLSKLLELQPSGSQFISLYLNTEPNETGKKDFDVFVKKQLNDHLGVLEAGSDKRASFEKNIEKIEGFLDSVDASTRGVALFASSGENDFFQTFEFEIPFEENRLYLFDRPFVFPLVRLVDRNPTFAVVLADTNSANIFVFKRAETIRREEIQNTKTNRSEVGGWSQARYQRHIENFHEQHAKEVVEELEKIVSTERIERVVLAGDQAVIIPLLREHMSKELSEKVIDTLSLNIDTPEHEIAEAARDAVAKHDLEAEKEKIDYLFEVNYDEGVGVTGFENTLSALFNGQVQELYLSSNPDDIVYRNDEVQLLLANYAPAVGDLDTREKEFLIDELIRQAALSAEGITFIEDPHLLKTVGGVGAILRYQVKGASNQ
ncbi:MAG TPA: Vms1/Ankzf1 family peptidyl-tRNA hydrolase [Pyrinomonadaceae bacterium]